ncbi:MAG: aminopeptidase P N-terminal domain-containing protein [Flammeovirgaceae bacterium]
MRYERIDKQLFINNRKRLVEHLKPNSIAVFNSNDIMSTSADGTMPFVQHTDIFHLTGIDQEESILVVYPDAQNEQHKEVLFLRETNEHIAVWEGAKFTKEEARELSGIESIYWVQDFEQVFRSLMIYAENVYLNTNEHFRIGKRVDIETREDRFRKWCMEVYPLHNYTRVAPIMHKIRAIKSETEIALLQKACDITNNAFRRILDFIKPGVWEYEIEAEILHEFIRSRSRGFAYEPIIGSGASSCVLHYIENSKQCKDGDILLMDFGAEYANYNADLTRTIPVNGRFSPRQKDVYNAVLRVHKESMNMLRPGVELLKYQQEVGKIMESELIGLGLLDKHDVAKQDPKRPLYKKYYMHNNSHHLGLNVHDYGSNYHKLEPGMVFTVEPGIYILEEGLGVRIENDVVVTEDAPFDLMRDIPIEVEEIEELMNAKSVLS